MKVSDLLKTKSSNPFGPDIKAFSEVIAYDAGTGKKLFSTYTNKEAVVEKFAYYDVTSIWADILLKGTTCSQCFVPVIKCFIKKRKTEYEND